jgi:ABC-type transport system involved in multi-copper enzyme maturation permease subunit
MNPVWRSLLWKEWREHRWILAFLVAGCLLVPLGFLVIYREWGAGVAGVAVMVCAGVPATAMFVGAAIAARERSQRTLGFMQALPASMKKAAAAKLLVACTTVIAPALLASLILAIPYFFRTFRSAYWLSDLDLDRGQDELITLGICALFSGAAAVSLLIWMAAAGVNLVDELRAGAIGLLVIALMWGAIILAIGIAEETFRPPLPPLLKQGFETVMAGAPGGVFGGIGLWDDARWHANPWQRSWPLALACLTSHGVLGTWYIVRFGRRARSQSPTESQLTVKATSQWLSPPRRSRTTAVVWKQFRESAPLAALGGLAIFIIAPIIARTTSIRSADFIEEWQLTAISTWLMAGVFVAVVAGIGVFYDDLRPGLHTFWRSRPIHVGAWFWLKLLTGLATTVGVLAAGPLLTLAGHWLTGQASSSRLPHEPSLANVIGAGLLLHAATFVLAALAIVLVRQPVMAAMLTFGAWIVIAVAIAAWFEDDAPVQMAPFVWIGVVGLATWSILAWQALRRDWGWGGTS